MSEIKTSNHPSTEFLKEYTNAEINRAILELGIDKNHITELDKTKLQKKLSKQEKTYVFKNSEQSSSSKTGERISHSSISDPQLDVSRNNLPGKKKNYVANFLKEATQATKAIAQLIKYKPPDTEPHIVQIVRQHGKEKKFKIDHEALATIFEHPRVVNKKIAIYSLAGPYRKGKSFMLNLFLLYLWSGRSPEWLDDKQKSLSRGFGWRGGSERYTQGILIWNEPFFIKTDQGEVAVFLMDTQGTYDNQIGRMGCVTIFALSTLISSVQIFNLSQILNEIDLQELQFFSEYGRFMQNRSDEENQPFQTLLFLIRDWQDPDEFDYGSEGGQKYLTFQMNVDTDIRELVSVRKNLKSSFSEVCCWLTPHPGLNIATRGKRAGPCLIRELMPEFLSNINGFAKYLFAPANIAIKQIDGIEICGGDFVNYITSYGDMMKNGNMPKPETAFEMTATAHLRRSIHHISTVYYNGMMEFVSEQDGFIEHEVLMEVHCRRMDMAVKSFNSTRHIANKDQVIHFREGLKDQINQKFVTIEKQNSNKWTTLTNGCGDIAYELCENVKTDVLMFLSNNYVPEERLQAFGNQLKSKAEDQYKKFNPLRKYGKWSKEYEKYLVDKIDTVLQRMATINMQNKENLENDLTTRVSRSKMRYVQEMDRECRVKYVESMDLEKIHQNASAVTWNLFGHPEGCRNPDPILKQYILKLQRLLATEYDKYIKRNKLNKEMIERRTVDTVAESRTLYKKEMQKLLGDSCRKSHDILKAHEVCKRATDALMESTINDQGPIFCEHYHEQIEVCLKDALNTFMCENEDAKRLNVVQFHLQKRMAFALYDEEMEKVTTEYIEEKHLAREHDAILQKALHCYGLIEDREPLFQYDKILQQLTREINRQFQLFREENEQNKKRLQDYLEMENEKLKSYYVDHMEKLCRDKFVKEQILESHHNAIVEELASVVRRALENKTLLASFKETCLIDLRDLYNGVLENNRRNRKYFLRRMVVSIFGSGGKPPLEEPGFSKVFASLSVIGGTTWELDKKDGQE